MHDDATIFRLHARFSSDGYSCSTLFKLCRGRDRRELLPGRVNILECTPLPELIDTPDGRTIAAGLRSRDVNLARMAIHGRYMMCAIMADNAGRRRRLGLRMRVLACASGTVLTLLKRIKLCLTIPTHIETTVTALYCGRTMTIQFSPNFEFIDPLVRAHDAPPTLRMFERLHRLFSYTEVRRLELRQMHPNHR